MSHSMSDNFFIIDIASNTILFSDSFVNYTPSKGDYVYLGKEPWIVTRVIFEIISKKHLEYDISEKIVCKVLVMPIPVIPKKKKDKNKLNQKK